MERKVSEFKDQLLDSEKSDSTKMLIRASRVISPRHTRLLVAVYGYMRSLDQVIDEGDNLVLGRELLEGERLNLRLGEDNFSARQEAFMGAELMDLPEWKRSVIRGDLVNIMNGMEMDLRIRETGKPLDAGRLGLRHLLNLWPVFNSFSVGWYDRQIKMTERGLSLIRNYGEYDALCDLEEDLIQGLILITDQNIQRYEIELAKGLIVPWDKVEQYYLQERQVVAGNLKNNAKAAFEMGLPVWMAAVMYLYMYKRSMRLSQPFDRTIQGVYPSFEYNLIPKV